MLVGNFDLDTLNALNNGDIETVTTFAQDFISSAMKFDTIFDVTLLLGMEAAIFMRLKTIKH
jgi:aromatic ring-opening dioxygenase LigB subunit